MDAIGSLNHILSKRIWIPHTFETQNIQNLETREIHGISWKFMEIHGNAAFWKPFAFRDFCISLAGYSCRVISRGIYDSVEADREPLPGPWEELLADVIVGEPGQPSLAISQFAIENGT